MAHIQRLYDFQPGTKIMSAQVDAEFNQLINYVNSLDDANSVLAGTTGATKVGVSEGGNLQTLLDKLVRFATANIKHIRLNADKVIETSANGVDWEASGSSGHLIQQENGTILPQRSRLQFINMSIIDDAANNRTVIQGGGTQGQLSNRNLLDNPDFAINQRGQTEYVNSDIYAAHAVDRWRLIGTLSVGNGYVVAKKDASPYGYGVFSQLVPGGTALEGRTLTLSAIINSVLVTVTGPLSVTPVSKQVGGGGSLGFQLASSGNINVFLNVTGGDLTISRCSLELGNVSTLANSPPADYGEELRKCQRYLWVPDCSVSHNPIAVGLIINNTHATYMLQFPQRMRIAPTIVPYGQFVAYNNMNHEGTLIVGSTSQESCELLFTITGETGFDMGPGPGTMLLANPLGGSKIIISAEL